MNEADVFYGISATDNIQKYHGSKNNMNSKMKTHQSKSKMKHSYFTKILFDTTTFQETKVITSARQDVYTTSKESSYNVEAVSTSLTASLNSVEGSSQLYITEDTYVSAHGDITAKESSGGDTDNFSIGEESSRTSVTEVR